MRQLEHINDQQDALILAIEGQVANLWTCLPGIIQSFNATKGTCVVQPAIKGRITDRRGKISWVNLPLLVDVPVIFPGGGSFVITFPIQLNDECLVIFSSRCIDAWWYQGGIQVQAELRMHHLSDGFAIVGPRSQPHKLTGVSTTTTQMRTVDGTAFIELTTDGKVNITAPGGIHVTGAITSDSEITAKNTHTVSAHTHTDPQGGSTGLPTG